MVLVLVVDLLWTTTYSQLVETNYPPQRVYILLDRPSQKPTEQITRGGDRKSVEKGQLHGCFDAKMRTAIGEYS